MRLRFGFCVFVSVYLFLSGCVPVPMPTKHTYKEGYKIQLLDSETRLPVVHASVVLHYARNGQVFDFRPENDPRQITETATTDDSGYIISDEASHMSYVFLISMPGGADLPGPPDEYRKKYGARAYYNSHYSFIPYTLFKIEIQTDQYEPYIWEIESFAEEKAPNSLFIKRLDSE